MRQIDTFPTRKIKDLEYGIGRVLPFGATIIDGELISASFQRRL